MIQIIAAFIAAFDEGVILSLSNCYNQVISMFKREI